MRNCFDGGITIACLVEAALVQLQYSDPGLLKYILVFRIFRLARLARLLRLFRLVRLMLSVPQLRVILGTVIEVGPDAAQYLMLLLLSMHIFCALGVQVFGGLITLDKHEASHKALAEMDFGKNDYWANNFNDMASGLITLLCQLLQNNWQVSVEAFVFLTTGYARVFFIAWYCFGVLIVLNIVIAVVLEAFLNEWKKVRSSQGKKMIVQVLNEDGEGVDAHESQDPRSFHVGVKKRVHMGLRDDVLGQFAEKLDSPNIQGVRTVPEGMARRTSSLES
ncbi:unnamed protein product [Chrysoparadoxa australica]